MTTEEVVDLTTVLDMVRHWTPRRRFELINALMRTIEPPPTDAELVERRAALARLDGMLAHVAPKPSDDDVKRILEEERMKKYG